MSSAPDSMRATVRASGDSITIELPRASGLRSGELSAVPFGTEALLLLKDGAAPEGYFAGSLGSVSMGELFGFVLSGIRTGRLVVSVHGSRKTVSFRDGQIRFATSNEPHERFGRKLVRLGLVTQTQLDEALAEVKPGAKLGQVLKQKGWVTASALYSAMTELVREIVLNLFELTEGNFLFMEGVPVEEDAVKVPGKVRDLVLEGVKRSEQVQLWRAKYPPEMRVVQMGPPQGVEETRLFDAVGSGEALATLLTSFDGSEYAFLSSVHTALQRGGLAVELNTWVRTPAPPARTPNPPVQSPLERYGALIQAICRALLEAGQPLADLQSFLADPLPGMERAFEDVTLGEDGQMDLTKVMQNATRADAKLGRVKAYEALEAFVSYALFSAKNSLPAELADSLNREFRRLQEGEG